ncbi:MAG: glutamate racemase [Capnocytophaga sp.]|nr:glutamate racemase [Capnocytophaga sp.]
MIGLFDSGIGGTSIWREIVHTLPYESTIFLADSANAPYGIKGKDKIISLCEKNVEFLLENHCKIIVVACNTATTNAISHLRTKYKVPFIGIEPAIKPASLNSKTKKIGVLATKGTLSSELFARTSQNFIQSGVTIIEQIGEGLVELIEEGKHNSAQIYNLLEKYLTPMVAKNIDYLVLGCTHYPYLLEQIQQIIPKNIKIIDSGEAVARQTKHILEQNNLLSSLGKEGKHKWLTNKNPEILKLFMPKGIPIEVKQENF